MVPSLLLALEKWETTHSAKPADQRVTLLKLVYRNKNMTLTIVSFNSQ